jgi:large subunit ribosomal protein L21
MKSAIISLDGNQFNIEEGTLLKVSNLENLENYSVLAYFDENNTSFGQRKLEDVKVTLVKLEDRLDDKVDVSRFRAKSRHRRSKGFRQPISILKVESIVKETK